MILPITALRLAVAAAVENVTTPLPSDFPDGDVIIWRRSDEGADNSSWLPALLPPSTIPGSGQVDPGFAPDYHTRIRFPQNSTDVLTVSDIAEIERMLVKLNDTGNATSTGGEAPAQRARRSVDDDDDDGANYIPPRSAQKPESFPEAISVPGYSEGAQLRPAPQEDDATSEFFGKFLGRSAANLEDGRADAQTEPQPVPTYAPVLKAVEGDDNGEQERDRRQATPTPPVTSTGEDNISTTLAPVEPTTLQSPQSTTIASVETSSENSQPATTATSLNPEEYPTEMSTVQTTSASEAPQPQPEYPSYPVPPQGFYPQYPQGIYPQYPQGPYPQYPQGPYPQYPQGFYPRYPQGPYHQYPHGFYPNSPGIIDPGFAPNPNARLFQTALEEQRRRGVWQPLPAFPQGTWQQYPGSSDIIDPGFAPRPIDQLFQRALEQQRQQQMQQGAGQAGSAQEENQRPSSPEEQVNVVYVDGDAQGHPSNVPGIDRGTVPLRTEDALFKEVLEEEKRQQHEQQQQQPSPPEQPVENVNPPEVVPTEQSLPTPLPESNRE
ncbi:uncharacterized protein LOC144115452 [Amblyomma americanum]